MSVLTAPDPLVADGLRAVGRRIGLCGAALLVAAATAHLVAGGQWTVALALILVLPGFVLVHRAPLSVLFMWLLLVPFLTRMSGGARYAYWLLHRGLPVLALVVVVVMGWLGMRSRPLARVGWPEAMMLGYVVASIISVVYSSEETSQSLTVLYDRVLIPMCLYLLVRLLRPTEKAFGLLVVAAAFVVLSQTVVGALSWVAPGVLPSDWLSRAGTRTTGSLASPSTYGVTLLGAGLILVHGAAYTRDATKARVLRLLFTVSIVMAVLTLNRAVWLATVLVLVALWRFHRLQFKRVAAVVVTLLVVLGLSGAVGAPFERLEKRFGSEESALSRLPVAYASLEMFEAKPLSGWGYGNFEVFDREFQREVGGFFPEKDHSSHNVYLTVLAEQGVIGMVLLFGPAVWWLVRSRRVDRSLPQSGIMSRKLLWLLWAVLGTHVIVNNFSNMKVVFGLGQWWLILGLIATLAGPEPIEGGPSTARRARSGLGR